MPALYFQLIFLLLQYRAVQEQCIRLYIVTNKNVPLGVVMRFASQYTSRVIRPTRRLPNR